jgi:hypothetical protein
MGPVVGSTKQLGTPWGSNRESRLTRERSRRCNRGRKPQLRHCHVLARWEGAVSRMIREPEDLPRCKSNIGHEEMAEIDNS